MFTSVFDPFITPWDYQFIDENRRDFDSVVPKTLADGHVSSSESRNSTDNMHFFPKFVKFECFCQYQPTYEAKLILTYRYSDIFHMIFSVAVPEV